MTSHDVRHKLTHALGLDLIGPAHDSELLAEILPQSPSRWYLTGFLVPIDADEDQKTDATSDEEVDSADDKNGTDDAVVPVVGEAAATNLPPATGAPAASTGWSFSDGRPRA